MRSGSVDVKQVDVCMWWFLPNAGVDFLTEWLSVQIYTTAVARLTPLNGNWISGRIICGVCMTEVRVYKQDLHFLFICQLWLSVHIFTTTAASMCWGFWFSDCDWWPDVTDVREPSGLASPQRTQRCAFSFRVLHLLLKGGKPCESAVPCSSKWNT